MKSDDVKNLFLRVAYILLLCAAVYVLFKYMIPLLMPFILALLIALLTRPLARFCKRKLKLPQRPVAALLVTIFLAGVAALTLWIGTQAIDFAKDLVGRYNSQVAPFIVGAVERIKLYVSEWDAAAAAFVGSVMRSVNTSVVGKLGEISQTILTGTASRAPLVLLQILFFIVAAYFFAIDLDALRRLVAAALPADKFEKLVYFKREFGKTLGRYARSYAVIFCMTFIELLLGFLIIGIPNFALIALGIALFDILPVVGSGTVMLPWALFSLLRGDTHTGIGLIVMYIIITVIRQFAEPRIIGKSVGLHPILTLAAIYVGMRLFGGIGLLGLPILLAVLAALEREGVTHILPRRELIVTDTPPRKKPRFKKPAPQKEK